MQMDACKAEHRKNVLEETLKMNPSILWHPSKIAFLGKYRENLQAELSLRRMATGMLPPSPPQLTKTVIPTVQLDAW